MRALVEEPPVDVPGTCPTPRIRIPLDDEHVGPGPSEVDSGGETCEACADDHGVDMVWQI